MRLHGLAAELEARRMKTLDLIRRGWRVKSRFKVSIFFEGQGCQVMDGGGNFGGGFFEATGKSR